MDEQIVNMEEVEDSTAVMVVNIQNMEMAFWGKAISDGRQKWEMAADSGNLAIKDTKKMPRKRIKEFHQINQMKMDGQMN